MSETGSVELSKTGIESERLTDQDDDVTANTEADKQDVAPDIEATIEGDRDDENAVREVPIDIIFDILKNQRRRHVFRYLKEHTTATLSDLAEHVAALENNKEIQNLTSGERKRVYVGLYQCHLPRMDAADIIDFDSDRGQIELNEAAYQLDDYLIDTDEPDRDWSTYYLGIATGGGVLYGLSSILFGSGGLPSVVIVFGMIGLMFACAALHGELFRPD